jgi:hypothetical protein
MYHLVKTTLELQRAKLVWFNPRLAFCIPRPTRLSRCKKLNWQIPEHAHRRGQLLHGGAPLRAVVGTAAGPREPRHPPAHPLQGQRRQGRRPSQAHQQRRLRLPGGGQLAGVPRGVAIRRPDLAGERGERGGVHDGEGARHVPQERRQRDQRGREGQALREDDNFAQGQRPVRRVPVQKRQNRHHRQGLVGRQERRTDRPPVARSGRTERGRVEGQADKQDNRRGGGGGHDHGDSELHLRSHGEKVSRR